MTKIGTELRAVKRELNATERQRHRALHDKTFEAQKMEQSRFNAFRDYALPRWRTALDPTYTKGDPDAEKLTEEEARALKDEITHRAAFKSAAISKLKAERRHHLDAAANGYLYEVLECDLVVDDSGTQVRYIAPNGEVVYQRAATGEERQMSLPDDELPEDGEANAKPKRKSRRKAAPGVVS